MPLARRVESSLARRLEFVKSLECYSAAIHVCGNVFATRWSLSLFCKCGFDESICYKL